MPKRKTEVASTGTARRGAKKAADKKKIRGATLGKDDGRPSAAKRSRSRISDNGHAQSSSDSTGTTTAFDTIQLRAHKGAPITFKSSHELQRAALQWSYVLCNRRRWNTSDLTRDEQSQRAQKQLEKIGLTREQLHRLAEFELVEVGIPYVSEKQGWEGRIFPWEYMLSAATRSFRDGKPLI